MVNPKLGTKRTCPSCNAAFYDLNANPAKCPKCAHSFNPEDLNRPKRGRGKKIEAVVKKPEPKKSKKVEGIDLAGFDDAGPSDGADDIEEIEEIDEMESLQEIGEFEDMDDKTGAEDETDEEALIEDIEPGEKKIVDSIDEEE